MIDDAKFQQLMAARYGIAQPMARRAGRTVVFRFLLWAGMFALMALLGAIALGALGLWGGRL